MCSLISYDNKYSKSCTCGNLRKTTRTITQFYDKMLQPTGLRSTQCLLLLDIYYNQNVSVTNLSNILLMDQSTVTRNVELLRKSGYIDIKKEEQDSRKKCITITDKGLKTLDLSVPIFASAQSTIEDGIGKERIKELLKTLKDIEKLVK
ncbi:MarR family winged helix-turn-helix transcriptional regulator [Clostridium estertheticum]|uniref:MarR family winged helix-turn-helix transcriptional regulator n=1 Tax=Clostridium estertheticum TaxID=238834 RepID=UPI001C7D807C|nr:MarR family winged helix-turn-helix transcriptional regulator [Clostridium estertheticum]MBX4264360.1 MarR family winged helix-turn-helix transcriptional regulator [Clostridium estertheticum]MBX4267942.1 MarR family winged helix-turn-helix transcriptional regulator [Clostridium estertheticum]WLC78172.1 MarR family winged helix-turn-helix transcriptional regulator [Clostridium estertheticum]WLC89204.1 MarR family winged helix-turn-helix transcriptional regulator [Clostridium estertheticum]